ncbi:MAG: B12-binding domain-containing radical SAM protein [Nitrospirae bacterium]|nr:B12-binding domain-containing radical SAM protein [Nitrospirota bacterium]
MKYNHVLALNPYYKDSTSALGLFPPTGLEYIATSMKDLVEKITLMDLRHEKELQNINNLNEFIRKEIDLICISITWNFNFKEICELICKLPDDIPVVVGGHKATEDVEYIFNKCPTIDVIIRGEGDETIKEIVKGVPYKDILGISYRENGKIVHNQNRPLCDINTIPFPDRSLRKNSYQLALHGINLTNLTFDTILTTRGCPYQCKFCTMSLNPLGQKREYAERSLESVIEELKTITADVVLFSDDNFFTNPKRSEKLCDLIIENNIKKAFAVQTRIEIARHPVLLEKAEKAGFKLFLVGIESPHDRILKQLQKGFTQDKIREAFNVLNNYNFYIHGYFIYGNISETEDEMVYIADFAKELHLDTISFQKLRIDKYSPLKETVDKLPGYYYDKNGGALYSDRFSPKDLKRVRNKIKSRFYDFEQIRHIVSKAWRIGLIKKSDLIMFFFSLPLLLFRVLKREVLKKVRSKEPGFVVRIFRFYQTS